MPRNLSASAETASKADPTRWVYLVELDFSSGFVRVTDAPFDIVHQGNTYKGIGDLGSISSVEETAEGRVNQVTLQLTGVKTSMVSVALNDDWRWRKGTIFKAFIDDQHAVIDTPHVRFKGWMDKMLVTLGGKDQPATIHLTLTSRTVKWEHANDNPRWDDQDHQSRRPGDKFFEFMPEIAQGKEIFWGKTR